MRAGIFHTLALGFIFALLANLREAASTSLSKKNHEKFTTRKHNVPNENYKPTSSRRDMIEGFNRESYLGSQDEYLMESPELSNGRPRSEAAGQQSVYVSMPDPYPDENGIAANPLGDTQVPTVSSSDYKIAYSDGLPPPTTNSHSRETMVVYDAPQDPLEDSNSNTVKIADPSANKKLFSDAGFSHGVGELNNAINTLLIDKVLNSDNDKDFNKELKLLTEEFSKDEKEEKGEGKKPVCQPSAKSIFANCKKKRSAVCSPEDKKTFFKNALSIHNLFRKIHGVSDLELNDKLSRDAQDYAEHLAKTASSVHSLRRDRPGQGENIAVGCTSAGSELRAKEAISQWYSKACEKGFDFNGYKKGVEPFAQLVWKATSFLGMGKAVSNRDGNLCTYIVARYSPEGDKTSFLENVPKGTFSKDGICNSSCVVKGNIANKEDSSLSKEPAKAKMNADTDKNPGPSKQTMQSMKEEHSMKQEPLPDEPQVSKPRPVLPEIKKVDERKENNGPLTGGSSYMRNDDRASAGLGPLTSGTMQSDLKGSQSLSEASKGFVGTGQNTPVAGQSTAGASQSSLGPVENVPGILGLSKLNNDNVKQPSRVDANAMGSKPSFVNAGPGMQAPVNSGQGMQIASKPSVESTGLGMQVPVGSTSNQKLTGPQVNGFKVSANEPTPKVPMLINITFPKFLQTKNDSMIQIMVGDDKPDDKGKTMMPQESNFKPVVNFTGKTGHILTASEEFFNDKEDRADRLNEGKSIEQPAKFIETIGSKLGYQMSDFVNKNTQTPEQQLKSDHVKGTAKSDRIDNKGNPAHVIANEETAPPKLMFEDRKGKDNKNKDDSETYLKIAKKLMHNGDPASNDDYFIPKQLESDGTSTYARERNEPDYGFTDESVKVNNTDKSHDSGVVSSRNISSQGNLSAIRNPFSSNNTSANFKPDNFKLLTTNSSVLVPMHQLNVSTGNQTLKLPNPADDKQSFRPEFHNESSPQAAHIGHEDLPDQKLENGFKGGSHASFRPEVESNDVGSSEFKSINGKMTLKEDEHSTSINRIGTKTDPGGTSNEKSGSLATGDKLEPVEEQHLTSKEFRSHKLENDWESKPASSEDYGHKNKQENHNDNQNIINNEKFVKLIDFAEIADHSIEKKKQHHGRVSDSKFMNLEKQVLAQEDNIFEKKPAVKNVQQERKLKENQDLSGPGSNSERDEGNMEKSKEAEFSFSSNVEEHHKLGLHAVELLPERNSGKSTEDNLKSGRNHEEESSEFISPKEEKESKSVGSSPTKIVDHKFSDSVERENHFDATSQKTLVRLGVTKENSGNNRLYSPDNASSKQSRPAAKFEQEGGQASQSKTTEHREQVGYQVQSSDVGNGDKISAGKSEGREQGKVLLNNEQNHNSPAGNIPAQDGAKKNNDGNEFSNPETNNQKYFSSRSGKETHFDELHSSQNSLAYDKTSKVAENDVQGIVDKVSQKLPSINNVRVSGNKDVKENNNITTISVGNGFINIQYEKPELHRNDKEEAKFHSHVLASNSEFEKPVVNRFHSQINPGSKNTDDLIASHKGHQSIENEERTGLKEAQESGLVSVHGEKSGHKSFSPVIDKENDHHFVIQIRPTHSFHGSSLDKTDKQTDSGEHDTNSHSSNENFVLDRQGKDKSKSVNFLNNEKDSNSRESSLSSTKDRTSKSQEGTTASQDDSQIDLMEANAQGNGKSIEASQGRSDRTVSRFNDGHRNTKTFSNADTDTKEPTLQPYKGSSSNGNTGHSVSEFTNNQLKSPGVSHALESNKGSGEDQFGTGRYEHLSFHGRKESDKFSKLSGSENSQSGSNIGTHETENKYDKSFKTEGNTNLPSSQHSGDIQVSRSQEDHSGSSLQGRLGNRILTKYDDSDFIKDSPNSELEKASNKNHEASNMPAQEGFSKEGSKDTGIESKHGSNKAGHLQTGRLDENRHASESRKGKTDTKTETPICKSNCPKSASSIFNPGKIARGEASVVGLNLQSGFDRFSGFSKVKSGPALSNTDEVGANSRQHLEGSANEHASFGNELIFIPQEALYKFQRDMTKEHNKYRRIHSSPFLFLNSKLSRESQWYANELARKGSVAHSSMKYRPDTGESIEKLCTKNGGMPTASQVLTKWYNEVCSPGFNFDDDGKQPGTGHFTQIIWKDTKALGVGLAASKEKHGEVCSYVVARYYKAGNDLGTIRSNVERGSFHSCNREFEGVRPTSRHTSNRPSHFAYTKKHHKTTHPVRGTSRHYTKQTSKYHTTRLQQSSRYYSAKKRPILRQYSGKAGPTNSRKYTKTDTKTSRKYAARMVPTSKHKYTNTGTAGSKHSYGRMKSLTDSSSKRKSKEFTFARPNAEFTPVKTVPLAAKVPAKNSFHTGASKLNNGIGVTVSNTPAANRMFTSKTNSESVRVTHESMNLGHSRPNYEHSFNINVPDAAEFRPDASSLNNEFEPVRNMKSHHLNSFTHQSSENNKGNEIMLEKSKHENFRNEEVKNFNEVSHNKDEFEAKQKVISFAGKGNVNNEKENGRKIDSSVIDKFENEKALKTSSRLNEEDSEFEIAGHQNSDSDNFESKQSFVTSSNHKNQNLESEMANDQQNYHGNQLRNTNGEMGVQSTSKVHKTENEVSNNHHNYFTQNNQHQTSPLAKFTNHKNNNNNNNNKIEISRLASQHPTTSHFVPKATPKKGLPLENDDAPSKLVSPCGPNSRDFEDCVPTKGMSFKQGEQSLNHHNNHAETGTNMMLAASEHISNNHFRHKGTEATGLSSQNNPNHHFDDKEAGSKGVSFKAGRQNSNPHFDDKEANSKGMSFHAGKQNANFNKEAESKGMAVNEPSKVVHPSFEDGVDSNSDLDHGSSGTHSASHPSPQSSHKDRTESLASEPSAHFKNNHEHMHGKENFQNSENHEGKAFMKQPNHVNKHFEKQAVSADTKDGKGEGPKVLNGGQGERPKANHEESSYIDLQDKLALEAEATSSVSAVKSNTGYLAGLNAGLGLGDASDPAMYEEPTGKIPIDTTADAADHALQDIAGPGVELPSAEESAGLNLSSLEDEAAKIETAAAAKENVEAGGNGGTGQSVEAGGNAVAAGSAAAMRNMEAGGNAGTGGNVDAEENVNIEGNEPEDRLVKSEKLQDAGIEYDVSQVLKQQHKLPSVVMDEYRYDSPEAVNVGSFVTGGIDEIGEKMGKIASKGSVHQKMTKSSEKGKIVAKARRKQESDKGRFEGNKIQEMKQNSRFSGSDNKVGNSKTIQNSSPKALASSTKLSNQKSSAPEKQSQGNKSTSSVHSFDRHAATFVANKVVKTPVGNSQTVGTSTKGNQNMNPKDVHMPVSGINTVSTFTRENKPIKTQASFQAGFQDAVASFGDDDDDLGQTMKVAATKKGVLASTPTKPVTASNSFMHHFDMQDKDAIEHQSTGSSQENIQSRKDGVLQGGKENKSDGALQRNAPNQNNRGLEGNREGASTQDHGYDTNRTRHFVIDKNNNLVLKPGESTGDITDFEAKNLAMLARQATFGINGLSNIVQEQQGIAGLRSTHEVPLNEKDYQSGVMAWTGSENPGLPSDEEVKTTGDISGQDLVEQFEKPGGFHTGIGEAMPVSDKSEGNPKSSKLQMASGLTEKEKQPGLQGLDPGHLPSKSHSMNLNNLKDSSHGEKQFKDTNSAKENMFVKPAKKQYFVERSDGRKMAFSDDMKLISDENRKELQSEEDSETRSNAEDDATFRQNALMWHNRLRCIHDADRVRLNDSLSKEAEEYAKEIVTKHNGILDHSKLESRKNEGENLAMTCSADKGITLKGAEATFKWYNDICEKGYDFRSNVIQRGTGHFTQLAWKGTTDFGIGRSTVKKNGRYCTVVVARYYPKGNIQKEFVENVNQGAYSDQTCENLAKEITEKPKFIGCKGLEDDGQKSGVSSKDETTQKPSVAAREREKARLNHEIEKVTKIINKLERDDLNKQIAQTIDEIKSEGGKGEEVIGQNVKGGVLLKGQSNIKGGFNQPNGHNGFVDMGGTGSPVVIYHGTTGFYEDPKTFTNIGVETHNKLRAIHKAPKLKLDMSLTMAAFQYATYLTQLGYLKHDDKIPKDQGENLAIGCYDNNSEMSAEDAVTRWYNEVCQPGYTFDNKIAESGTGHFTQVVWKGTTKVGIAKQTRMHGNLKCTYIVARYSPAGNVHGGFTKNVIKGNFDQTVCKEVMVDLLKFQQRNEKMIPKLEGELKEAQEEAKMQERLMALMQLKAMQNQKEQEKQGQKITQQKPKQTKQSKNVKTAPSSKVSRVASNGKTPLLASQGKTSSQGKTLLAASQSKTRFATSQAEMLQGKTSLKGHHAAFVHQLHNATRNYERPVGLSKAVGQSKPRYVTGVLNNGLKTIVEDNTHLMHIGPTMKIVEQGKQGGLIYKSLDSPPRASQTGVGRNFGGSAAKKPNRKYLMHHGYNGILPSKTFVDSNEFANPVDQLHVHGVSAYHSYKPLPVSKTLGQQRQVKGVQRPISENVAIATGTPGKISWKMSSATFDLATGRIIETELGDVNQGKQTSLSFASPKQIMGYRKPISKQNNGKAVSRKIDVSSMNKNTKHVAAKPSYAKQQKINAYRPKPSYAKQQRINAYRPYQTKSHQSFHGQPQIPKSLQKMLDAKAHGFKNSKTKPFVPRKPVPVAQAQRKIPESLLRMMNHDKIVHAVKPVMRMPIKVIREQHKIPDSLLRMLKSKSKNIGPKEPWAYTVHKPVKAAVVHHEIPNSLLRMLKSKPKAKIATKDRSPVNYIAHNKVPEEHKLPESLQRMLNSKSTHPTKPVVSGPTAKFLTQKPYKITLGGHRIPFSLFKMLTAEAQSGKDPKISKYLTKTPFKITQEAHEIPESLRRMLNAKKQGFVDKKLGNTVKKVVTPLRSPIQTMTKGSYAGAQELGLQTHGSVVSNNIQKTIGSYLPDSATAFHVHGPTISSFAFTPRQDLTSQVESQNFAQNVGKSSLFSQAPTQPIELVSSFAGNVNTPQSAVLPNSGYHPESPGQTVGQTSLGFSSLETSPAPISAVTRTTVASRYPESSTTMRALVVPNNKVKGPSAAKETPPQGASGLPAKPYMVTVMESTTPTSFDPKLVGNGEGKLVTAETEKDREEFERSALETHNLYRRIHGVNPLQMNYGMSIAAEKYAKKIAELGRLDHSGVEDGENIASVCRKGKSFMSGPEATDVWYKEICNPGYDFKSDGPGGSGHFTQVIWKGTSQLGIGRAEAMRDGLLCTYVVARYRPAGNFLGEFAKNVFKGNFDGSECSTKSKKSFIEVGPQSEKNFDARIMKRSRIQKHENMTTAYRKGQVETDEEQMVNSPFHVTTNDDAVIEKMKSLWLPDLESGIHSSDLAGLIPLRVAAGTDIHFKKYANATMEDIEGNDSQLASNFAAKLIEQVKKARNTNDLEGKSKTSGGLTSKEDIDAASKGFQNMDESFKKSEPTLPPGSKVTVVGKYLKTNSNKAIQSGSARSGESPVAADISSKVNQAIQKLQSAAETVSKVAAQPNLPGGAPPFLPGVADSAMAGIQATTSNEAMAKFAANMIAAAPGGDAAVNGPPKPGGSPPDFAINGPEKPPVNPAAQGAQVSPLLNGQAPPGGPGGSLAAANMAAANQQALSKAAEDKKAASAGYIPTELEQSGLNAHNRFRAVHDAPPLVLNQDLSKDADAWAKQLAALGMPRRSQSPDGENVVESCKPADQEMTASEAVETWYSELCNPGYNFQAAEITGAERFSQLVWQGTTEMGIGKATRPKADLLCTYIVARYRPPGNQLGDIKPNVQGGKIDAKLFCKQFLAASRIAGRNRILDNLPVKSDKMEDANTVGSTLHAGKSQPEDEIVAGGDEPGADGASTNKKEFRNEALYTHNRFRAVHNAPPLQLDVKKCQEAEQMAADLAAKGSLMRSRDSINGQNIAMSCNKDGIEMTGDEATNKWYNEVCNPGYDFKGTYPFGAAHFMQVVWASSKKFGIGKATTMLDNMLCTWVVALYEPSGAMRNMQGENVLIGLFDYQYCDTFGKGGGGKGASSGAMHNNADTKISAPNAAQQPAGKRGLLDSWKRNDFEKIGSNEVAGLLSDQEILKGISQEFINSRTPNKVEDGLVQIENSKNSELRSFTNNSLKVQKDINRKSGAEERSKTHRKEKRKKSRKHAKASKQKRKHLRQNHERHHHHHQHHHHHKRHNHHNHRHHKQNKRSDQVTEMAHRSR